MSLQDCIERSKTTRRPLSVRERIEMDLRTILTDSTTTEKLAKGERQEEFLIREITSNADLRRRIETNPNAARAAAQAMPVQRGLVKDVVNRVIRGVRISRRMLQN